MLFKLEFFSDDLINERLSKLDLPPEDQEEKVSMKTRYAKIYSDRIILANEEQKEVIDAIFNAVTDAHQVIHGEQKDFRYKEVLRHIFVCGEGGSGKTWTFNVKIFNIFYIKLRFY